MTVESDLPKDEKRTPPKVSGLLLLLGAGLVAVILAVTGLTTMRSRSNILADTERQLAQLDMVFAEQTGRAIETVDFLLKTAIEAAETKPPVTPEVNALLVRRLAGVRQVTALMVADATGHIVYATQPQAPNMLPRPGAQLLDQAVLDPSTELRISDPEQDANGKWYALVTRAIVDPQGHVTGMAAAMLNLAYFEEFYDAVQLDDNGAIVLHRRDGTVLARFPHADGMIGTSFADLPPFRDILAHAQAGTVIMDSPLDGSRRVLAIRALKAFPLAVNVSVDEGAVLSQWRYQTGAFAAAAVAACIAISGLVVLLARRSRQVEGLIEEAAAANRHLRAEIGERERAEAALLQAQRAETIGQLTRGVAHDFNNLLSVVLGNIDLMLQGHHDQQTQARLETMRNAAERGATLTGQLMAFARRQPLVPRAVDLNALVRNMRDLLESGVGSRVKVELHLHDPLWPARVDPTQIELAVLNLVINARDAMGNGGAIIIETGERILRDAERSCGLSPGDYVSLAVSDTGHGMAPDVVKHAFEPFFTTKSPGQGSGLGLSQVHGIVYQSGGSVSIDSVVGHGTTVTILLPRAASDLPTAGTKAPERGMVRAHGARVLLVDDDAHVREVTAAVLKAQGYEVSQAASGEAALQCLQELPEPDVLVSDVVMPGMSGPALIRRVRQIRPDMPAVLISGFTDPDELQGEAMRRILVRKPFTPAAIAGAIEAAMREPIRVR